jgi:hypothetical protein
MRTTAIECGMTLLADDKDTVDTSKLGRLPRRN